MGWAICVLLFAFFSISMEVRQPTVRAYSNKYRGYDYGG